jgi:hypothetical protein
MMKKPGYHLIEIPKGVYGMSSKILEEVLELQDAEEQSCSIMQLVELSDLYGAIEAYLALSFPEMTMEDLKIMSHITKRAFINGHRD